MSFEPLFFAQIASLILSPINIHFSLVFLVNFMVSYKCLGLGFLYAKVSPPDTALKYLLISKNFKIFLT